MNPIVLAHGFFGFSDIIGIRYFRNVEKDLKARFPGLTVLSPEVAPNDGIELRAQQLWEQIDTLNQKVHIIAHSMGGLDARYMISPQGMNKAERVLSLTTLCTPHRGTPVADAIIHASEIFSPEDIKHMIEKLPALYKIEKKIINALKAKGELVQFLLEFFSIGEKGIKNLAPAYLATFNKEIMDAPGVQYFSYAGVTGPGEQDYLPVLFFLPWAIIFKNKDTIIGGRNDGFVAVESAKWGTYKGELPADHFKISGHDMSAWGWLRKLLPWVKLFNHYAFYRELVAELIKVKL